MRLDWIELGQVRRFGDPVRVTFSDGLNILAEPNETGKSTILAAIRAVFLLRHGSSSSVVKALRPRGSSAAPHITVSFTVKGETWRLEKRFLSRAMARLTSGTTLFEGEAAEDRVAALLGLEGKRGEWVGMWNVLWVQQGESLSQPDLSDTSRTTLTDCLHADLGDVTGTTQAARMIERVRAAIAELRDGHRKPRNRYRNALQDVADAQAQHEDALRRHAALESDLSRLGTRRADLARLDNAEQRTRRQIELAQAQKQRDALQLTAERDRTLVASLTLNRSESEKIVAEQKRRLARKVDLAEAEAKLAQAIESARMAEAEQARARAVLMERRAVRGECDTARTAARTAIARARRQAELRPLANRLADIDRLLARIEAAERQAADARRAIAELPVDDAALRSLRVLDLARIKAKAGLEARATIVRLKLNAGVPVLVDGVPATDDILHLVTRTTLSLGDLGAVDIEPAVTDHDVLAHAVREAETRLAEALDDLRCADIAQAEMVHANRQQAEAMLQAASAAIAACLPSGTRHQAQGVATVREDRVTLDAALRAGMAALGTDGVPDDATLGLEALESAEHAAQEALDQATAAVSQADSAVQLIQTRLSQALVERERIADTLSALKAVEAASHALETDAALQVRLATQHADALALANERRTLAEASGGEDLALLEARIARLGNAIDTERDRVKDVKHEIALLEQSIQIAEGDGLDEKIAEALRAQDRASADLAWCERELAILDHLLNALLQAEQVAREKYLGPLSKAIQPGLQALFPRARAELDDHFGISGLHRLEHEPIEHLSDGTREQIAVLVRLAFAELMLSRERPAMVILDDALTFSDSARLDRMFDILGALAARMQIIVLTCRAEMFEPLGARRLSIEALPAPRD